MALGSRLAEGRTAEIYEWDAGRVIKLFREGRDRQEAEHEAHLTRAVREAGFGAPRIDEIIEVDGRAGIIMERIDGGSMWAVIREDNSDLLNQAQRLGELHAAMHQTEGRGLPSQRQRLIHKIRKAKQITQGTREFIVGLMRRLEDGASVCHGDFHPDNVIYTPNGLRVIDWVDAVSGSPIADVARTLIVLEGATYHEQNLMPQDKFRTTLMAFAEAYLARYIELSPIDPQVLNDWLVPVAAARLTEGIDEEEGYLLARIEDGLR